MQRLLILLFLSIAPFSMLFSQSSSTAGSLGINENPYQFDKIIQEGFAKESNGFWLFYPENPEDIALNVVVFVHGYGAINSEVYGSWIEHLVKSGNIVIYPRYQKNLMVPSPGKFAPNAAKGIQDALAYLNKKQFNFDEHSLSLVGHSYGGVICSNLAAQYQHFGIPKPVALLLCSPGTGPFSGGILKDYTGMPDDLKFVIMVSTRDRTVGDKFGKMVYANAKNVVDRNLILQHPDSDGSWYITAGHNESYAFNKDFDNGYHNYSSKRASKISKVDAVDKFGYWKIFDALMDCGRNGKNCKSALGNTKEQCHMGFWPGGKPIKPLEVIIP